MATDGAGRTIWNDKTRSDLLQVVVEVFHPTSEQSETISAKLRAKGYTYTWGAALQHLQKLKKKEGNGAPSLPATPKKPKTPNARTPKSAGGTGRKRKAEQHQNRDEDEDDDEEKIMKKKVKYESADLDHFIKKDPSTAEDGVIP